MEESFLEERPWEPAAEKLSKSSKNPWTPIALLNFVPHVNPALYTTLYPGSTEDLRSVLKEQGWKIKRKGISPPQVQLPKLPRKWSKDARHMVHELDTYIACFMTAVGVTSWIGYGLRYEAPLIEKFMMTLETIRGIFRKTAFDFSEVLTKSPISAWVVAKGEGSLQRVLDQLLVRPIRSAFNPQTWNCSSFTKKLLSHILNILSIFKIRYNDYWEEPNMIKEQRLASMDYKIWEQLTQPGLDLDQYVQIQVKKDLASVSNVSFENLIHRTETVKQVVSDWQILSDHYKECRKLREDLVSSVLHPLAARFLEFGDDHSASAIGCAIWNSISDESLLHLLYSCSPVGFHNYIQSATQPRIPWLAAYMYGNVNQRPSRSVSETVFRGLRRYLEEGIKLEEGIEAIETVRPETKVEHSSVLNDSLASQPGHFPTSKSSPLLQSTQFLRNNSSFSQNSSEASIKHSSRWKFVFCRLTCCR